MKTRARVVLIAMFVLAAAVCRAQDATQADPETDAAQAQNTTKPPSEFPSDNLPDAGQAPTTPPPQTAQVATQPSPQSSIDNSIDASEGDEDLQTHTAVPWNQYRGRHFTIRFGAGLLYEADAYAQNQQSKEQFSLLPEGKLRDFRFLIGGSFPDLKRITWSAGIMYDAPTSSWLIRQTGVMIALPEIWGHIFIGRGKEGFSLNKVMTGYDGWTMERSTMNDATIPILADGIKWLGYVPKLHILWNLGYYNDFLSKNQSFSTYSSQEVLRFAYLPILSDEHRSLLHLGINLRNGVPENEQIRFKSRPEVFPAPFFVDTGSMPASSTQMAGYEVYYRKGPWMFGSEYWFVHVTSPSESNPLFKGGDFAATWLITGETRPYDTAGGFFREIVPLRSVFKGGPGAWEVLLRYSQIDLDSHTIQGGQFGRITPGLNWYLSDSVRLEFEYGFGRLDRFNLKGDTQYFQTRVQLQL